MNADTIIDAIGDIDEELYDRSAKNLRTAAPKAKAKARVFSSKHVLRIAIAAALALVIGVGLMITTGAKGDVLPPARWGAARGQQGWISYNKIYSFDTLYDDAEAVCLVTIGNWLGDNGTGTFFEARVDKLYKGSIPENIVVYQGASKEYTSFNYPVFTFGDKMLIGVNKLNSVKDDFGINDYYSITGGGMCVLYYAEDKAGNEYVFDNETLLSITTLNETDIRFENRAVIGYDEEGESIQNSKLLNELYDDLNARDHELAEMMMFHKNLYPGERWIDDVYYPGDPQHELYVYSLEELEAFFAAR